MRKSALFAIVSAIFFAPAVALADHMWTPLAPEPTPTEGACDGVIGNNIYVAFGFTTTMGDSNLLRIYNIATNTWSFGPPAPTAGRSEMYRGVVHNGTLYCVGGRNTNENWSFTPATNTWTPLAPLPGGLNVGSTATDFGNNIYMFGGRGFASAPCSGPGTNAVLRYDIDTDTWSSAGNLVVPRSDATAARFGSLIYVFGGCNTFGTFLDSTEVYNPRTQTSFVLPALMPGGARADAAAAVAGPHTIRVTGGTRGPGPAQVTPNDLIFDVGTNTYSAGTEMPRNCPNGSDRAEHDLVYHGGRIYAVGGSCPFFGLSQANLDMLKLSP